jgi:hypothetical protein
MASVPGIRISWLPAVWAAVWVVVLGFAFFSISWSYVDVHNVFREATSASWPRYIRNVFTRGIEYRPVFTLGVKSAYDIVGLHLWFYQALVMLQLTAALALLLWVFRPVGAGRAIAAIVALSCILGLHTSRILFLFVPLNVYSGALVLLLLAIALTLEPRTRSYDWILFPLTLVALFSLESSLLIVPIVIVVWWLAAPGVSLRGAACAVMALAVYLTIRFTFGTSVSFVDNYVGSGLGLSDATPEALRNTFEHAPWLFWLYNVSASLLTVVASEPRAGVYQFIASLLRGSAPFWQWFHVMSSVVTTAVVVAVLTRGRLTSERDRLLCAIGLMMILLGSGLGFLYTRDRIGLSAGVGYGILVYVALATLLERMPASGFRRVTAVAVASVLALVWTTRTAESYVQLRDTAWDYRGEWTDRYEDVGGAAQPQTELLTSLRTAALSKSPDDPRRDPAWTFVVFERRFDREGDARRPADDAADNAVVAISQPFDIRWKDDVDDATRPRLEAELGLTDAQRVERDTRGRTWEYRLRTPTRDRVRAIVVHPSVEDTARIERERFEIVR